MIPSESRDTSIFQTARIHLSQFRFYNQSQEEHMAKPKRIYLASPEVFSRPSGMD